MFQHSARIFCIALVIASTATLAFSPNPALAQTPSNPTGPTAGKTTITVTTQADEWDDDTKPASANTKCSLREALQAAYSGGNRGCGANKATFSEYDIKFFASGTFKLTRDEDLPHLGGDKIFNLDAWGVEIDGGSQALPDRHYGIFQVVNATLNLKNLVLKHGSRPGGGAIWLRGDGVVTAYKVKFKDNDAAGNATLTQTGGAILAETGTLTVTESTFESNVAIAEGGAVATSVGYFYRTKFIGNEAASGGAIRINGPTTYPVQIIESEFKQNRGRPSAFNDPDPGYETRFDNFGGGAIQNSGNLYLARTVFDGNFTELNKGGGGLSNEAAATATLEECVFTKNKASAKASGDSNNAIDFAWGGAIYNAGELNLVRCSIHGNQADFAGAIMNHKPGKLNIYNSTITNNTAKNQHGGLVNEHPSFDPNTGGAEMRLVHTTIGKNNAGSADPLGNLLYASDFKSIWFTNSIIDTACNVVHYSLGHSVFTGPCLTEPDPNIDPNLDSSGDITNTTQTQLGLQSLSSGSSAVPNFKVQKIDGGSIATDIGRDDAYGCSHPKINRKDQNQDARGAGGTLCDAGAIEAGSSPPQFSSSPGPGLIEFPIVDLSQGQSESKVDLTLFNLGGGAMSFLVLDEGGSPSNSAAISNESQSQGFLFKNQEVKLTFKCAPPSAGDYWRTVSIETNAPNKKKANYKFRCTGAGNGRQASLDQQPGPLNMPATAPGQASHTTINMTNRGKQPLTADYGWTNNNAMWASNGTKLPPAQAQSAQAEPNAPQANAPQTAITLNPGETLQVDATCTPTGPGIFINTFVLQTNDPANPTIEYNVACQGEVSTPPEAVQPSEFYDTPSQMEGVAISRDGSQVLAGQYNEGVLHIFSRNKSTGALSGADTLSVANMNQIYGIQYSHDNRHVYYTSQSGDGVAVLARQSNSALSNTQVITTGTRYICGSTNQALILCPIGTLNGARGIAISPDDKYVYVTGYIDGSLTVLRRNTDTGRLSFVQSITRSIGGVNVLGGGVRVTTSPDGDYVYVAAYADDTLAVFKRNDTGRLNFIAAHKDGTPGFGYLDGPTDVLISPDGNYAYVAARRDNALGVYARSSADGRLTFASVIPNIEGAWGLGMTHDNGGKNPGKRVFVSHYAGHAVQAFGRDEATGQLNSIGTHTSLLPRSNISGPVFFAVSPDNLHIYLSLYEGMGVRLFETVRHAPVLGQISPASALAGSTPFTLTVRGARFYPDSRILWNGTPQINTQFVSERELQLAVPASALSNAGDISVAVRNLAPGGDDSDSAPFKITTPSQPPVPSIESVQPPEAEFGSEDLTLVIHGANFAPNAQVSYNGQAVPTQFINSNTLQAALSAGLLIAPGTGGLAVTNGAPNALAHQQFAADAPSAMFAAASSIVGFKTTPPELSASPALSSLVPSSAVSGTAGLWMAVLGHNFSNDSDAPTTVRWNGQARSTVVVSDQELRAYLSADDVATAGQGQLTALTPGASESEPLAFTIRLPNENPVPVANSLSVDSSGGVLTLLVNGDEFAAGAQVLLNGVARNATVVDRYQVSAVLTPEEFLAGGEVRVANVGPGGGTSGGLVLGSQKVYLPVLRK